jgi:hypothetical protein
MKPEKPSILTMIKNFTKESVKFISEGAPVCTTEQYEKRIKTCGACEHFSDTSRCNLCGCFMPAKAGWQTSECADDPKRWLAIKPSDDAQTIQKIKAAKKAARDVGLSDKSDGKE